MIIIINDNSQDSTENEAKKHLKTKFKQFKIINGKKLPVGWSGKVGLSNKA